MCHVVTLDELSFRLKRSSSILHSMRLHKNTDKDQDDTKSSHFNSPFQTLSYLNQIHHIGIRHLAPCHMSDDALCCILFDLANLPQEKVQQRLVNEGAIIEI
jgi:hypothetical protein